MQTKMREEAKRRLKALNVMDNVIKDVDNGVVYYSERTCVSMPPLDPFGALFWLRNEPEWEKIVKKVEEDFGIFVYALTHEHTGFGECLTMLFVPEDTETWEMDYEDVTSKGEDGSSIVMAYVYNLSNPIFSEFGSVGIKEAGGGLIRTA